MVHAWLLVCVLCMRLMPSSVGCDVSAGVGVRPVYAIEAVVGCGVCMDDGDGARMDAHLAVVVVMAAVDVARLVH